VRYLLTNDDGIYARGLQALVDELSKEDECLVVAPEREQSAVGHAISLTRPLMVKKARRNGRFWGYAVSGTPADCVKIGVKELAIKPIDCIVSGINLGPNVGIDVIYSGTVSAATEGAILGIPSVAISLNTRRDDADFTLAARFAKMVATALARGDVFPRGVPLNVNVPALAEGEIKGIAVARQGRAQVVETYERRVDPRENVYYWLVGEDQVFDSDESHDSDAVQLRDGMITITPIHFDLTRYDVLEDLRKTVRDLFP